MKNFLNDLTKVRGLRNNNPGNLIKTAIDWQGKITKSADAKFEQFQNLTFGIRACLKDIIHDINKGKNTVRKLISEYAPPNENNTNAYIASVASSLGVGADSVLKSINASFLLKVARAIFKVELGSQHVLVEDSDIKAAIKLLGNVSTDKLTVSTETNFFFLT